MTSQLKVLVADPDERIRHMIRSTLERHDLSVKTCPNAKDAIHLLSAEHFDLVIAEYHLHDMAGDEFCWLVHRTYESPLMLLSHPLDERQIVNAFQQGIDDFIAKPFQMHELEMRVFAILKRSQIKANPSIVTFSAIRFPEIEINPLTKSVYVQGKYVPLTAIEFKLLLYLAEHTDKVCSREELLREVWNYRSFDDTRTVDTHIKRLRIKIGEISNNVKKYICTVRGFGYRFDATSNHRATQTG